MSEIHELLEVVLRLEQLRTTPPAPLHLHLRQRDGSHGSSPSKARPERATGQRGAPQQHASGIDYHSKGSKGMKP